MRNKHAITSILFIVLVLILSGCGSSNEGASAGQADDNEKNEEQSAEREIFELTFEVVSIDIENSTLQASFETNLPDETEIYRLVLKDEEGRDSFVEYEFTTGEENVISFPLNGANEDTLVDKEYQLSLEFNVTERTNKNLFTDEFLGGSFAEMDEAYQDSEHVLLKDLGEAYTISLMSSNSDLILEDYFVE